MKHEKVLITKLVDIICERVLGCFGTYSSYKKQCVSKLANSNHICEVCIKITKFFK